MAFRVCKGTFTAATSTGVQTVTGVADGDGDFEPVGLLLWSTYQTAAGYADELIFHLGMTDGTTHRSVYTRANDNANPSDCDAQGSNANLVVVRNLTGTNVRVGAFSAFDVGEFAIDWTTADAVAAIWHFVAFGGDDIEAMVCSVPSVTFRPTPQPTFPPKALFIVQDFGALDRCFTSFGWAAVADDASIAQGATTTVVEDNQSTSDTWRYQRINACSVVVSTTDGSVFNDVAYTHLGLGFTNSGTTTMYVLALGGDGLSAMAGSGSQPTSNGTQTITTTGLTPKVVFVASVGNTAQTTTQAQSRLSLGAGTGTAQGRTWFGGADAVDPSVTARGHSTSVIISAGDPDATGSSTVAAAEAALDSLAADEIVLDWTATDATVREYIWIGLGDAPAAGGGGGEHSYGCV